MKILVTGASGFIGQKLIRRLVADGHDIIAITRSDCNHLDNAANLKWVQQDLQRLCGNETELFGDDIEVVIHLAAVVNNSSDKGYEVTTEGTGNLLRAMDFCNVNRMVFLGSLSVLDYAAAQPMSVIEESLPLCTDATRLGCYALTKRDQEEQVRDWHSSGKSLITIRAGLVYGCGRLSSAHAGVVKSGHGLLVRHGGQVPLISVDRLVDDMALAIEHFSEGNEVLLHMVDDDLPVQGEYLKQLRESGELVGIRIMVGWRLFGILGGLIRAMAALARRSIPDSFYRNSVAARYKPFLFSNDRTKQLLSSQPVENLTER